MVEAFLENKAIEKRKLGVGPQHLRNSPIVERHTYKKTSYRKFVVIGRDRTAVKTETDLDTNLDSNTNHPEHHLMPVQRDKIPLSE
jgi:hypothetical protein